LGKDLTIPSIGKSLICDVLTRVDGKSRETLQIYMVDFAAEMVIFPGSNSTSLIVDAPGSGLYK
jgi:hypothetical protein